MLISLAPELFSGNECHKQLRSAHSKLEADLSNSRKRFAELIEQRDSLKKGREESVSLLLFDKYCYIYCCLPLTLPFHYTLNQPSTC